MELSKMKKLFEVEKLPKKVYLNSPSVFGTWKDAVQDLARKCLYPSWKVSVKVEEVYTPK
jgi:hypothetical protein